MMPIGGSPTPRINSPLGKYRNPYYPDVSRLAVFEMGVGSSHRRKHEGRHLFFTGSPSPDFNDLFRRQNVAALAQAGGFSINYVEPVYTHNNFQAGAGIVLH